MTVLSKKTASYLLNDDRQNTKLLRSYPNGGGPQVTYFTEKRGPVTSNRVYQLIFFYHRLKVIIQVTDLTITVYISQVVSYVCPFQWTIDWVAESYETD